MAIISENRKKVLSKKYCVGFERIIEDGIEYIYIGNDCDSHGRTVMRFIQVTPVEKRIVLNDKETKIEYIGTTKL